MSDIEISLESLGLKKPLDKMTAKELRQMVIEKVPQITGVSGMTKDEIVTAVKEAFGIADQGDKTVSPYKAQIATLKGSIRDLRTAKLEASSRKDREIVRRKINKLKKRTRRLAAVK